MLFWNLSLGTRIFDGEKLSESLTIYIDVSAKSVMVLDFLLLTWEFLSCTPIFLGKGLFTSEFF